MNSTKEVVAAGDSHESWSPLLQLATREVFELMLGQQLSVSPADAAPAHSAEVTAMVGLAGKLCGLLSVRCDEKCAALMTSKMLGIELEKAGPDMSDALGEICNMVAGNFKNKISGLGDGCMLSPPTVITGSDYSMYSLADSPGFEVRMQFENMPFVVTLQIHS
jgi:chemotaxis protein CheX